MESVAAEICMECADSPDNANKQGSALHLALRRHVNPQPTRHTLQRTCLRDVVTQLYTDVRLDWSLLATSKRNVLGVLPTVSDDELLSK